MTPEQLPGRITTRLAIGTPAALGVLLLAGAIAFGHTSGFLADARTDGADASVANAPAGTDAPGADEPKPAGEGSVDELTEARGTLEPKPEPTPKPTPAEEEPKPEPASEVAYQPEPPKAAEPAYVPPPAAPAASLVLAASLTEYPGKVVLTWTAFDGGGFGYYKLVRSHDAAVTWPASGDDELIGAFGSPDETWAKDRPPCGTTVHYAVFAVSKGDDGYGLLAPSNIVSATLACPPAPPPTSTIGFDVSAADGAVHLAWGACASEHFNAYKVVRSQTNPNPTYPENEGAQLIAAIGDRHQTTWTDVDVASGQTWFYRVFARADNGGGTYIACNTQALSVTIP
jgi:hypothetical protein